MLNITIPAREEFDSDTGFFSYYEATNLSLEHSLLAISKWESKWQKPFFDKDKMTNEEFIDYVRCMTITKNVPFDAYYRLGPKEFSKIEKYITSPMTATTFSQFQKQKPGRERITSELIYYWMITAQIPFEAEKWHINRLFTLIRICDIKNNSGNNKMSKKDIYAHNRQLNAARRAKLGSKG